MTWTDLAFLHWRMPADRIRALVPRELELDTFDGSAWVAVTPFTMRNVHVTGLPGVPTATNFPELNVRTYVRHGDRAGVYFFSLDAASKLAVVAARAAVHLPYHAARMRSRRVRGEIHYKSTRSGDRPAEFRARYLPTGEPFTSQPGSLEHFLTERYSLFTITPGGAVLRLDIEHDRWPLQPGSASIETNTMADAAGVALPDAQPHVLFSATLDVVAHLPKQS